MAILEARVGTLTRQLAECEAGRKLFNDLEATHSSMQRRLAVARASDEIYGRELLGPGAAGGVEPPQQRPRVDSAGRRERERHLPVTGFM